MRGGVLIRLDHGDEGTFGRIVVPGLTLFTGELPWRNNLSNLSCIPPAVYNVVWDYSPHFGRYMYLVLGADPRAGIRAHSANFMGDPNMGYRKQLNGCIALGEKLGWMDGQKALLVSAPAVRRFEEYMKHEAFKLEIING